MKFDKKMIIIIAVIIAVVGGGLVLATSKDPRVLIENAEQAVKKAQTETELNKALKKLEKLYKKYPDVVLEMAFQGMKELKNEGDGHKPDISGLFK